MFEGESYNSVRELLKIYNFIPTNYITVSRVILLGIGDCARLKNTRPDVRRQQDCFRRILPKRRR